MAHVKDYDSKLFRLVDMLKKFHENETPTTKELSLEYNVSTKTITRDLAQLERILPIEKHGHKWGVARGHTLDKTRSYEEELVLDILGGISSGLGKKFGSISHTLFSKLQNEHQNPIYSKIEIEDIHDKLDMINDLQHAITQQHIVRFLHNRKERLIKPYKITTFEGYWYLYGEEVVEGKLKTFYLKEMTDFQLTQDTFTPQTHAMDILKNAINIWFQPNSKPFEVHLLVKSSVAKYFYRRPLSATQRIVKTYENGDIELVVTATSEAEIIYELKKWLPQMMVLEPRWLIPKMLDISQTFIAHQTDASI